MLFKCSTMSSFGTCRLIVCHYLLGFAFIAGSWARFSGKNWYPEVDFSINADPFIWVNSGAIRNVKLPTINNSNSPTHWVSISGNADQANNMAYLLLSSVSMQAPAPFVAYPFATTRSGVVKCALKQSQTALFGLEGMDCKLVPSPFAFTPKFFGRGLYAGKTVYMICDPMWINDTSYNTCDGKDCNVTPPGACTTYNQDDTIHDKFVCNRGGCFLGWHIDYYMGTFYILYKNGVYTRKVSSSIYKGVGTTAFTAFDRGHWVYVAMTKATAGTREDQIAIHEIKKSLSSGLNDYLRPEDRTFQMGVVLTSVNKWCVLVGLPYVSVGNMKNVGRIYMICGKKGIVGHMNGTRSGEHFGYSVANVGDVDGDGMDDLAVGAPSFRSPEQSRLYIIRAKAVSSIDLQPLQIITFAGITGPVGLALSPGADMDFNGRPDVLVSSFNNSYPILVNQRLRFQAQCSFEITPTDLDKRPLKRDEVIKINLKTSFYNVHLKQNVFPPNKPMVNQFSPDLQPPTDQRRFEIVGQPTSTESGYHVTSAFQVKSTEKLEDMDFRSPILFGYRSVFDCSQIKCEEMLLPLIDWSNCSTELNIVQFHCGRETGCESDLDLVNVTDQSPSPVLLLGVPKTSQRTIQIAFVNRGPTEAKRVQVLVTATGSMRISSITMENATTLSTTRVSENKTEALLRVSESLPVNVSQWYTVETYFEAFGDPGSDYKGSSLKFNLTAGTKDLNQVNNAFVLPFSVVYTPQVFLGREFEPSTLVDNRTSQPYIGKDQNIQVDTVGPRLNHTFMIENTGNATVKNLTLTLQIPVSTSEGQYLIYMFEKIRWRLSNKTVAWVSLMPRLTVNGAPTGECLVPPEYINPMLLKPIEIHSEHEEEAESERRARRRRAAVVETGPPVEDEPPPLARPVKPEDFDKPTLRRNPQEVVRCGKQGVSLSQPICANIRCRLGSLPKGSVARLTFLGWLWSRTFFKKSIADVEVFTTLFTDMGYVPDGVVVSKKSRKFGPFHISQNFLFKGVKPKITHQLPIWPMILGIILGVLLLTVIIVALYKCGFFKRQYRKKNKKPKGPSILHPADLQPTQVDDDNHLLFTGEEPEKDTSAMSGST